MLWKFYPYKRVENNQERESRSETNTVIPSRDRVDSEPKGYEDQELATSLRSDLLCSLTCAYQVSCTNLALRSKKISKKYISQQVLLFFKSQKLPLFHKLNYQELSMLSCIMIKDAF